VGLEGLRPKEKVTQPNGDRLAEVPELRGIGGAVVALPFLECFGQATNRQQARIRFGAMFMPNEVDPSDWQPKGVGTDFELSPVLLPLKDHRSNITVVSNLTNESASSNHIRLTSEFLCGQNHVGQQPEASIAHLRPGW